MKDETTKDNTFVPIELFEKVTITYNDGKREVFDAIYIRDNGVYTGIVLNIDNHEVFVESGGIPKNIVKHIEWDSKKTVLRKTA